jgi:uncharacterized protein (DUF952 family)
MGISNAPSDVTDVWHICPTELWEAAVAAGTAYVPSAYDADGFVHCCSFAEQLVAIGNHYYRGDPRAHCLLRMPLTNAAVQSADVRFEAPAPVAGTPAHAITGLFPHIYGPIELSMVSEVVPLKRTDDGEFLPLEDGQIKK